MSSGCMRRSVRKASRSSAVLIPRTSFGLCSNLISISTFVFIYPSGRQRGEGVVLGFIYPSGRQRGEGVVLGFIDPSGRQCGGGEGIGVYRPIQPPSTVRMVPCTYSAAFDAKN